MCGRIQFPGDEFAKAATLSGNTWSLLGSEGQFGLIFDCENGKGVGLLTEGPNFESQSAIWETSQVTQLPNLPSISQGLSINASGHYVGVSLDVSNPADWVYGGYVGIDGSAEKLNYADFPETRGFKINDENWITGIWAPDGFTRRGYIARDEEIHDLGLLSGFAETWVGALNNDNTVVGGAANYGDFQRALIWPNGALEPQDLNAMVNIPNVTLIRGIDINNAGQILVEARIDPIAGGGFGYYVLTPVPEPTGMALLACTAGALLRRRSELCE